MRTCLLALAVVVAASLVVPPASLQDAGAYEAVDGWVTPFAEDGFAFGSHTGVFAESPDRIFIVQSGEIEIPSPPPSGWNGFVGSIGIDATEPEARAERNFIFVVDGEGNVTETWSQWDSLFEGTSGPHRVRMSPHDPEKRVWVVHESGHAVYAFSNDGQDHVMTLGMAGMSGNDEAHLSSPQDVAFLEDGSILVGDGDNTRVVMYDAEGAYVTHFGERGNRRGYFEDIHSVATDSIGRIYVTDRVLGRIQAFNQTTRAAAWYHPNISPVATWSGYDEPTDVINSGYDVWVVENSPARIIKLDSNGNEQFRQDVSGTGPGQFQELHQISVDADGNVYGADSVSGRTVKLTPRADADFQQLIRPDEDLLID